LTSMLPVLVEELEKFEQDLKGIDRKTDE